MTVTNRKTSKNSANSGASKNKVDPKASKFDAGTAAAGIVAAAGKNTTTSSSPTASTVTVTGDGNVKAILSAAKSNTTVAEAKSAAAAVTGDATSNNVLPLFGYGEFDKQFIKHNVIKENVDKFNADRANAKNQIVLNKKGRLQIADYNRATHTAFKTKMSNFYEPYIIVDNAKHSAADAIRYIMDVCKVVCAEQEIKHFNGSPELTPRDLLQMLIQRVQQHSAINNVYTHLIISAENLNDEEREQRRLAAEAEKKREYKGFVMPPPGCNVDATAGTCLDKFAISAADKERLNNMKPVVLPEQVIKLISDVIKIQIQPGAAVPVLPLGETKSLSWNFVLGNPTKIFALEATTDNFLDANALYNGEKGVYRQLMSAAEHVFVFRGVRNKQMLFLYNIRLTAASNSMALENVPADSQFLKKPDALAKELAKIHFCERHAPPTVAAATEFTMVRVTAPPANVLKYVKMAGLVANNSENRPRRQPQQLEADASTNTRLARDNAVDTYDVCVNDEQLKKLQECTDDLLVMKHDDFLQTRDHGRNRFTLKFKKDTTLKAVFAVARHLKALQTDGTKPVVGMMLRFGVIRVVLKSAIDHDFLDIIGKLPGVERVLTDAPMPKKEAPRTSAWTPAAFYKPSPQKDKKAAITVAVGDDDSAPALVTTTTASKINQDVRLVRSTGAFLPQQVWAAIATRIGAKHVMPDIRTEFNFVEQIFEFEKGKGEEKQGFEGEGIVVLHAVHDPRQKKDAASGVGGKDNNKSKSNRPSNGAPTGDAAASQE